MRKNRANRGKAGVTLIELLVVSTVITLLAAIALPILQLVRQGEKEKRLREILLYVRNTGIGTGAPYQLHETSFGGGGYRNFIIKHLFAKIKTEAGFNENKAIYAIGDGFTRGTIYPLEPKYLVNPLGFLASYSTNNGNAYINVEVTTRFIKGVPPHPFVDWFPNAHWEFKAAVFPGGDTGWYASDPVPGAKVWPRDPVTGLLATGVVTIKSVGAGMAINGENTDSW